MGIVLISIFVGSAVGLTVFALGNSIWISFGIYVVSGVTTLVILAIFRALFSRKNSSAKSARNILLAGSTRFEIRQRL